MPTVLIVEDNPGVAKFYMLALERRGGFDCRLGRSGEEVIALARSRQVDLILLDISLADFTYQQRPMDGLELSRLLKKDPATCSVPVILATAHAMVGDRERFLELSGADDYLQKPIYDPEVLVEKVNAVLAQKKESASGANGPAL